MDLRVAIVGHVDHGKSTLIGRLLYDTGNLAEGKAEEIIASSQRRGLPVEWSFAVDAAQEERDQAITIETTRVWLRHGERRIVIIDTPGHREFIRNMMSGAADADGAILVVDALEGLADQTYRHAYLLQLLDVPQLLVAVNKIDAVGDPQARYEELSGQLHALLAGSGKTLGAIVPISARDGDNVATRSARTGWYRGPTMLEALLALAPASPPLDRPLRFSVQDVYRQGEERVAVGRVESGTISVGERIRIAPSGAMTRVRAVRRWPHDTARAIAGDAVGLTFDDPVFLDRGDAIVAADAPPATIASSVGGVFFWLASEPPAVGQTLQLRLGTSEVGVTVAGIEQHIDLGILDRVRDASTGRHSAFALQLRAARTVPAEVGARCVLARDGAVVAGGRLGRVDGLAQRASANVFSESHLIGPLERAHRNGYRGCVAWFTGLPSSGKSTLAMAVERELFARGYFVYVLDGDNLRMGLNVDLGFTREARRENIRRMGEVAALFADAGAVVLVSAVSPHRDDRAAARSAAGGAFHEIYVRASVAACEGRDRKGLYKRARAGMLPDFTGVSAPYDEPESAEIVVDTEGTAVDDCVHRIVSYLVEAVVESPAIA